VVDRALLIRHGETEWSARHLHTGRTDVPLNADGERRAAGLRPALAALPGVDQATVWTSPLQRAGRTCELAGLGDRAEVVEDLAEWNYGEFEGTRTADLRVDDPAWSIWTTTVHEGESLADVGRRADRVVERLDRTAGVVIAFAHAHLLRILAARWCGFEPAGGQHLTLSPATISVLGYEREIKVVERWNQQNQ
jgi:broad specificity phosphatase PhoE